MEDILKKDGLSLELLRNISYQSKLGMRLKKNLHYFDKKVLFEELVSINKWYDICELLGKVVIEQEMTVIGEFMCISS